MPRDIFVIAADAHRPAVTDMIAAIDALGFVATLHDEPNEIEQPAGGESSSPNGAVPALVQSAFDRAKRERKLVLLDFHADWCRPCQRMRNETFAAPTVVSELAHFIVIDVNIDAQPVLARYFGVAGIPDVRILLADGTEAARWAGFKGVEEVFGILRAVRTAESSAGE